MIFGDFMYNFDKLSEMVLQYVNLSFPLSLLLLTHDCFNGYLWSEE